MSIVAGVLPGARVLDLFAGVGNVGIEALSRGAASATFVELEAGPIADIRHNLERTRLADRATIVQADVFAFLLREPSPHELVFCGPPQWQGLWSRAAEELDRRPGWLAPDGIAVVQCDPTEHRPLELEALVETDRRRYGGVHLAFFRRR